MESFGLELVPSYRSVNDSPRKKRNSLRKVWATGVCGFIRHLSAALKGSTWRETLELSAKWNVSEAFFFWGNTNLSQLLPLEETQSWGGPCGLVSLWCRWSPCIEANLGHSTERRPGPVLWRKLKNSASDGWDPHSSSARIFWKGWHKLLLLRFCLSGMVMPRNWDRANTK